MGGVKPNVDTNFCRVFELPTSYSEGFCFGGGKPVMMKMVDWFNPWPLHYAWEGKQEVETWAEVVELLRPFMEEKSYVQPGRTYVLITDFGESMVFGKAVE